MLDTITDVLKMVPTGSDAKQCGDTYQWAGLVLREPPYISCYAHQKAAVTFLCVLIDTSVMGR
jgi:hypothetical protein